MIIASSWKGNIQNTTFAKVIAFFKLQVRVDLLDETLFISKILYKHGLVNF